MANSWDGEQLRAITRWFGASNFDPSLPGDESQVTAIDRNSSYGRILRTLQDLCDSNIKPEEAAEDLASNMLTSEDITGSWSRMLSAVCSAAEFLDRAGLFRLADVMVELAKMPHTLPSHPHASDDGSAHNFPDGLLFSELSGFGFTLRETFQAPTQYICRLNDVTVEARNAARGRWCNANSFLAILTHYAYNGMLPKSMDCAWRGLDHITVALEGRTAAGEFTEKSTRPYREISQEKLPSLWVPAAIMWINLAGQALFQSSAGTTKKAGSLWAEHQKKMASTHPSYEYSVERWSFWSRRLHGIADLDVFSLELTAACDEAASQIDTMLEEATGL